MIAMKFTSSLWQLLMVEGALESGEDDLILKHLAKLTPEQHVLVLKDLYKKQMTADGYSTLAPYCL